MLFQYGIIDIGPKARRPILESRNEAVPRSKKECILYGCRHTFAVEKAFSGINQFSLPVLNQAIDLRRVVWRHGTILNAIWR